MAEPTDVVTVFLRNGAEVLLLHRADDASTYSGRWAGISGYVERDDPGGTAWMELREETAIGDAEAIRAGEPLAVEDHDAGRRWRVHPFLFETETREVRTNEETAAHEWVPPTEILRRETVPGLWEAYRRVAPSPETIAADGEHGSAYLSIRALEVLRDAAGEAVAGEDGIEPVEAAAEALLDARPSMSALANRVNRVISEADDPEAAEGAAIEGIERAREADEQAASEAAALLDGGTALTLSRSGTVLDGILEGADAVVVAESRPAREGVGVAERLAAAGIEATLCTDAAIAHVLAGGEVDAVLVGADAILPDGRVVNKTGTRGAALAAAREGIPCYAVAATDKVQADDEVHLEWGDPAAVYDGDADVEALNPTFDVTPADLVDGVVTERGVLDADDVASVAGEHRERARWRERVE